MIFIHSAGWWVDLACGADVIALAPGLNLLEALGVAGISGVRVSGNLQLLGTVTRVLDSKAMGGFC